MGKSKGATLKIVPLEDRVVIKRVEVAEATAGGIVLPDTAKEKPQRGKVVAVGPGTLLKTGERGRVSVSVGDTVLFGSYAGTDIKVDDAEYLILRESDILGFFGDPTTEVPPPRKP